MPVSQTLLPWLPALLIAALSAAAIVALAVPATKRGAKERRLAAITILGIVALGTMVWQAWAAGEQIARLKRNDHSTELASEVRALEEQIAKLKQSTRARTLGAATAAELADYLRAAGSHAVVVSCIPNDIEAYGYATEIADALKSADWDARGPETTTIFGDLRAMGINIFDNGRGSGTAKILVSAFEKAGVPYQTRVPPTQSLDSGTVELFIGARPGQPATATVETAH